MRVVPARSLAFEFSGIARFLRWLQAGFSSFAYRLAHLSLPRSFSVGAVALLLYLS